MQNNQSDDFLFVKASQLFIKSQMVSKSLLVRRLGISQEDAERIMARLESGGVINSSHDELKEEYIHQVNDDDNPMFVAMTEWKEKQVENMQMNWFNKILLKVLSFSKKYWWVWLLVTFACIAIMVIGPSTVGHFAYKFTLGALLFLGVMILMNITIGSSTSELWRILRLIGFIGFLIFTYTIFDMFISSFIGVSGNWDYTFTRISKHKFLFTVLLSMNIVCLFTFAIGEHLLYLHKINNNLSETKLTHEKLFYYLRKSNNEKDAGDLSNE